MQREHPGWLVVGVEEGEGTSSENGLMLAVNGLSILREFHDI